MNIREKLLFALAQDPNFEGNDATEKALVTELKAELKKEAPAVDADVAQAAKAMATELVAMVKGLAEAQLGVKAEPATADRPNMGDSKTFNLDSEVEPFTKGMTEEQAKEFKKAYRFSEFSKSLVRKDEYRAKALAEGVDADGGYLVPDQFRAELIQHLLQTDSIRKYATVIPMSGKLLEIPKLTSDVQVTWGTENRSISTTTADFGSMTLTPFRMNAIIYTSRELFDDSALAITEILRARFRDRVADEENKVFITGNGTTQPKGIDAETFTTVNCGNAITPDHLTKAYWKLPKAYRSTARWLMNSRVMEALENKKDSNGQYLYPSLQAEVKTLKGRPILVDDYVASSKGFFGDLSYYYIGDRQQMSLEVTTEGGNTWEKHQVGLKLVERIDGEVALTSAFVELSNTGVS